MIKRILYEYDYNKEKSIVNNNCLDCMYFKKCVDTLYDKIPDTLKFVQNCKNYLFNGNEIKDKIIKGGIYHDDYGSILFNNNFHINLNNIKRFYVSLMVNKYHFKGWHGHKIEGKYCLCLTGIAKIGMVKIDNFQNPSKDLISEWYILKENDCEILYIPGGYANGLMSIVNIESKVLFFSTMSISESMDDDYRYDKDMWIENE